MNNKLKVLEMLVDGEESGRRIRAKLAEAGVSGTAPEFYQIMARLEDRGFVTGWYDQDILHDQEIKNRVYRITGDGMQASETARDLHFVESRLGFQGS
jgi:DNA-binding PadR family transcriptional regulator